MSSSLIEGLAYAATTTYMLFVSSMALAIETLFTSGVFCFFALAKAAMGSMNKTHSCPLGNCVYRLIRAVRTCWQVYFTSSPQGTGPLWNASCQWINSLTLYSNSNNHCYRTVNRTAQKTRIFSKRWSLSNTAWFYRIAPRSSVRQTHLQAAAMCGLKRSISHGCRSTASGSLSTSRTDPKVRFDWSNWFVCQILHYVCNTIFPRWSRA